MVPEASPGGSSHGERVLHYRVLRPLGAGGMGEVYLAEDERLGRRVALKFLPRADSADPERRERLKREARALASLSHLGIAAVYALEEHGDRLFLAMEYIEGETLADRLARRPLPVTEVIERGRVLAEALAHAHARGVTHRDVKPSNILITPDGATKLADFGLAFQKGETRLTAEGSTAGTADHMSPEQTRGETGDVRSDLFSLGVVLYEALTGVRPFARPTLEATFHAIRADEPETPTALRSGIPLELERIVMKLLRKDPAERYQTANDLAADLRALRARESRTAEMTTATSPATGAAMATQASPPHTASASHHLARRRLLWALPAILILIGVLYLAGVFQPRRGGQAEAASRSLAVLAFQHMADPSDTGGEAAMATNLLTVGLGQSRVFPVLSNQRVHDVLRQMGKSERSVTGANAIEVGRRAGATYIVVGYIYRTAPNYMLGAEVTSTTNGAVLTSCRVQASGGDQGIFSAIDSLTLAIQRGLANAGVDLQSTRFEVAELTTRNPAAYRAYIRGIDLLHHADRTGAAKALSEAVQADSTFALAWYNLAVATWWSDDHLGAARITNIAGRLGNRLVGRERNGLGALHHLVTGEYPKAASEYRTLLERYPDDKEFLYGLGEALYHEGGDLAGARAMFERTVALDPTFAVAFQHIIDLDIEARDKAQLIADADRFQRLNPTNPVPTVLKMNGIGALGDGAGSAAIARDLVTRYPENAHALREMAVFYRMTGSFDSAAVYARRLERTGSLVAFGGTPPVALLFAQGRYREADRVSAEALRSFDFAHATISEIPIPAGRVRGLLVMGRHDEAWRLAVRTAAVVRHLQPHTGAPWTFLADVAVHTGRNRELGSILAEYDRFLHQHPSSTERRNRDFIAGQLALQQGRPREAIRLIEPSRPLGPPGGAEHLRDWTLARAHLALGERDRAMPFLERVVSRATYAGDVLTTFPTMMILAKEYEVQGRRDEALGLYRRVAHQFRFADPGVRIHEEALAAVDRLERAGARAAAD